LPAGLSARHFGHSFASGAPQSPQNFLLDGFSAPHFEQRISAFPLRDLLGPDGCYIMFSDNRIAVAKNVEVRVFVLSARANTANQGLSLTTA
jgi:hypothetical protein